LFPRFSGLCASTALVVMTAMYVPEILTGADAGECHCFGALMSMTIGPLFLLRNSALIALGVLVVTWDDGALSLMRWFTRGAPHAGIRP
jgi:hypothetical protein